MRQPAEVIGAQLGKLILEVFLGVQHCEDIFRFREGQLGGEVDEEMEREKKGEEGSPLLRWTCRDQNNTCCTPLESP